MCLTGLLRAGRPGGDYAAPKAGFAIFHIGCSVGFWVFSRFLCSPMPPASPRVGTRKNTSKPTHRILVAKCQSPPRACLQIPQVARLTGFWPLFRVLASPMRCIDSARNPKNWLKTSLRGLVPEFEDTPYRADLKCAGGGESKLFFLFLWTWHAGQRVQSPFGRVDFSQYFSKKS